MALGATAKRILKSGKREQINLHAKHRQAQAPTSNHSSQSTSKTRIQAQTENSIKTT
jgi:hypothetical protein